MSTATLGQRRELFTVTLAQLLLRMGETGFRPRLDEVKRSTVTAIVYGLSPAECDALEALLAPKYPALAGAVRGARNVAGIARSVHVDGLAADVQLWRNGELLATETAHRPFGEWWERQHELCRWGGRFGDPGHYSVTPDGVRK